ncbi:hypothetical protein, partial [Nostoc sp. UHCC 0251]|uniref:hypothetical protein n=1 Tax=Nostoc sp. UHCC 0251 TaxID=3110240 RepID=UPI002B211267
GITHPTEIFSEIKYDSYSSPKSFVRENYISLSSFLSLRPTLREADPFLCGSFPNLYFSQPCIYFS